MNKRHSTKNSSMKKTIWIALASALAGAFLTFVLLFNFVIVRQQKELNKFSPIIGVFDSIKNNYYENVSDKKLTSGAVSGMLSSLDDPYSVYLTGEQQESVNSTISGSSFAGIGVVLKLDNKKVLIDEIQPDTPAAKSKLEGNDQIIKVDNHVVNNDLEQVSKWIRGKVNSKVKLTILRNNQEQVVTLTRKTITQSTVDSEKLDAKTGIIRISEFDVNTGRDVKLALEDFEKQKLKNVIIDVRQNPGGVMDSALTSASYFVKDKKVLMQYQFKNQKAKKYYAGKKWDHGFKTTLKPIVLIDDNSASAAEIFAAALNQSAGAKLVGQKSYGKGTVQQVGMLSDDQEFKFTVAQWLTPNGTWINKKGLTPTIKTTLPNYLTEPGFTSEDNLKLGDKNANVKTLQNYLIVLGYLKGQVSGNYDNATVAAVKVFQTANKLPVDGVFAGSNQVIIYQQLALKASQNDVTKNAALKAIEQ